MYPKPGGLSSGATLATSSSPTPASPTSTSPGRCSAKAGTRRRCLRRPRSSSPRWDLNRCQESSGREASCRSRMMAGVGAFHPLFALNHLSRLLTLGQHVENWPLHWQWLWPWENTDTVCPQVQITRLYHTFNLDRHWSPTKCGNMKICPMASNEAGGKFHRNTTFASSPLQW